MKFIDGKTTEGRRELIALEKVISIQPQGKNIKLLTGAGLYWVMVRDSIKILDLSENDLQALLTEKDEHRTETAILTEIWDGKTRVSRLCRVNLQTKEAFEIGAPITNPYRKELTREYITINQEDFPVYPKEKAQKRSYWYE